MSAMLSASELNDFLAPGLACVKPAEPQTAAGAGEGGDSEAPGSDELQVQVEVAKEQSQPVSISLADCLACSGCITSAEEVLLSQNTHTALLATLKDQQAHKHFVMSVSHQARVSVASHYGLSVAQADLLLSSMFKQRYGFSLVVGLELARCLSVYKTNTELLARKLASGPAVPQAPLLSAVCPGFVLYAEKTKPELLKNLLNVKSPQQINGNLLKNFVSSKNNVPKADVFHVCLMPCFDKKLEAARKEPEQDDIPDVDFVITPKELVEMIRQEEIDISEYLSATAQLDCPAPFEDSWKSHLGSASGGYAENYILFLQQYYKAQGIATQVRAVQGKNADVVEFQLLRDGEKMASSCIVNGFRNIQNLVRKLNPSSKVAIGSGRGIKKRTEAVQPWKADYVEVMACPGGCINGGGLLSDGIQNMNARYSQIEQMDVLGSYQQFIDTYEDEFSVADTRLFQYQLKPIEKRKDIVSVSVW